MDNLTVISSKPVVEKIETGVEGTLRFGEVRLNYSIATVNQNESDYRVLIIDDSVDTLLHARFYLPFDIESVDTNKLDLTYDEIEDLVSAIYRSRKELNASPYIQSEEEVNTSLVEVYNGFSGLQGKHPSHMDEITFHIHALQRILMERALGRQFPDKFTIGKYLKEVEFG